MTNENTEGIVYVLTNPAMDGYVKIGRTGNLPERLRTLFNGSLPVPFDCYYAARVADAVAVEQSIHEIFGDTRVNPRREFFTADPHRVRTALQMVALEEVNADGTVEREDVTAVNKVTRRGRVNFRRLGIPVGTELTFIDRPDVICTVSSQDLGQVEFEGLETSLSASAQEVLGKNYGVNGMLYWMHEGQTLSELRDQLNQD